MPLRTLFLSLAITFCTACGDTSPSVDVAGPDIAVDINPDTKAADQAVEADVTEDPTEAAFAPDRLLEISVEIEPDDWDELCQQTRTFADIACDGLRQLLAKVVRVQNHLVVCGPRARTQTDMRHTQESNDVNLPCVSAMA